MGMKSHAVAPAAALGSDFSSRSGFHCDRCDRQYGSALVSADIGHLGFISTAMAQPGTLTKRNRMRSPRTIMP